MRPPTGNPITQGKHGKYNAVDYNDTPDDTVYAPEDMTYHAYYPLAGDAGNNLQMMGAHGRHGFCHLDSILVKPGQSVKKGEPIAKMGYTGLTIPKGPAGKHLHWVLYRNGVYVYPPTLITEPFGGSQGGNSMDGKFKDDEDIQAAYVGLRGERATQAEVAGHRGSNWRAFFTNQYAVQEAKNNAAERAQVASLRQQVATLERALTDARTAGNQSQPIDPVALDKVRKYDAIKAAELAKKEALGL